MPGDTAALSSPLTSDHARPSSTWQPSLRWALLQLLSRWLLHFVLVRCEEGCKQNHQVLLELAPICKKKKWLGTNVFIKGAPASPFSCRERWWLLEIRTVLRRSSQWSRKSPDKINFFPYRAVRATNQCYFLLTVFFPRPPQAWVWGQLCSAQLLCAQRWAKHGICLWKGAKLCLQTLEKINIKHLTLHPI